MPGLLAALFEADVASAETLQPGDTALLHAEEAAVVAKAIAKRAGEFAAGRLCAHQALRALGAEDTPLLVAADRRPLWPDGIVGSITHTHGFYGAVAAFAARYASLGIDAELASRVGPHLWPRICTPAEIAWIEGLEESARPGAGALVFSGKEAFYKCQYGLTRSWVGFHDVELQLDQYDIACGRFALRPTVPLALQALRPAPWQGRHCITAGVVVSGMAFEA